MAEYTEAEHETIRSAAFGAIALVSKADPGFFSTFKESMAGSRAFAAAPPAVQELLKTGGFPTPPKGDAAEVERQILDGLRQSMTILNGKDAAAAGGFRDVIVAAADAVADASKGTSAEEAAVIAKIREAVGGTAGPAAGGTPSLV
ncbi:hypothetical protein [Nostocoides australiense]|nr:hypothetical protein [Austwickia sp.]HPF81437.1 hypothetical protein [Tetrasphaera australiensis]HRW01055.1 hypothetical protein [Tetrasphaera sp.]